MLKAEAEESEEEREWSEESAVEAKTLEPEKEYLEVIDLLGLTLLIPKPLISTLSNLLYYSETKYYVKPRFGLDRFGLCTLPETDKPITLNTQGSFK